VHPGRAAAGNRLSVFDCGFGLDAAEAVGVGEGIPRGTCWISSPRTVSPATEVFHTAQKRPLRICELLNSSAVATTFHRSRPASRVPLSWLKPNWKVYVPGWSVIPGLSTTW
jgi:hypothetical protein